MNRITSCLFPTLVLLASCKVPTNSPKAWVAGTLAGSGASGYLDAIGTRAQFNKPYGVAVDRFGNVYVADYGNHSIRKITISDSVNEAGTFAGSGAAGSVNGVGSAAQFNDPNDVAVDRFGNVYVADYSNHRVRKITAEKRVSTLAGGDRSGYLDGAGISARFYSPIGVAVDLKGSVYVTDFVNHRIRKLEYKRP